MSQELVFVAQVAPYVDGPAGVHGVLDQAATAAAQLARMHDLTPVIVTDVELDLLRLHPSPFCSTDGYSVYRIAPTWFGVRLFRKDCAAAPESTARKPWSNWN